jgi:hypothetical protein
MIGRVERKTYSRSARTVSWGAGMWAEISRHRRVSDSLKGNRIHLHTCRLQLRLWDAACVPFPPALSHLKWSCPTIHRTLLSTQWARPQTVMSHLIRPAIKRTIHQTWNTAYIHSALNVLDHHVQFCSRKRQCYVLVPLNRVCSINLPENTLTFVRHENVGQSY